MSVSSWNARFFESTRGRIVALLRRGSRTVDELAGALSLTDNAVRAHLATLERDGIVRQQGVRPSGGKPAYAYGLRPEAERLFSQAYIPLLTQLLAALGERMRPEELEALMRAVGRRWAASQAPLRGDLRARVDAAAGILTALGGVADVEERDGKLFLRGYSCPLAAAVEQEPGTCQAAESLLTELVGAPVHQHCNQGERPRCCFEVTLEGESAGTARGTGS